MEADIRVHIIISGRVQGVFFRANTKREAVELGLTGWVKNKEDGSVEAVLEGPEARVKEMLLWCKQGPMLSRVDNVEVKYEIAKGEIEGFEIRY